MTLYRIATTNLFQGINAHIQQSDKLISFSMHGPLHHNMLLPYKRYRMCELTQSWFF